MGILFISILLSACGREEPEPTATPTKTPETVTQSQPDPTNTPAPVQQATSVQEEAPQTDTQLADNNADSEDEESQMDEEIVVVTATILNVRSQPNIGATIVREVRQGEQFTVIGRTDAGDWLQLTENGQPLGWPSAQYLAAPGETASTGTGSTGTQPTQPTNQTTAPAALIGGYLPATMRTPDFGAQTFLWWRSEVADRDLGLMKDGGFNWVKQTFAWETIEGAGPGQFDWAISDRVVRQVNNRGLKLLARVSSDPEKRNFWPEPPPGNSDQFANFLFEMARRYNCTGGSQGCIQAYQIWNEPNLAREWGDQRPNPTQYVQFLRKAYAAAKRGNPNAIVINAGMAPTGTNSEIAMPDDVFYDQMYQAMGGNSNGYFDMLGVHGAGFAAPPELDPGEAGANKVPYGGERFFAFRHVEDIRRIMERYGDGGKKIVLLEFGWTYDSVNASYKWHGADAGIDQFVQADYLKRAYQYAAANWPWIGLMSLLTMPNVDWLDGNPQDEEQFWWAIMDPSPNDNRFRAAYIVLCDYFNEVQFNLYCPYDPDPSRRGSR